jgi:hypothetical protein
MAVGDTLFCKIYQYNEDGTPDTYGYEFTFSPPPNSIDFNPLNEEKIRPRKQNYPRVRLRLRPRETFVLRGAMSRTDFFELWGVLRYGSAWVRSGWVYKEDNGTDFAPIKWKLETAALPTNSGSYPSDWGYSNKYEDQIFVVPTRLSWNVGNKEIRGEILYNYTLTFERVSKY